MIYEVLKRALKITWNNPSLWFFGFLSTFFLFSSNEFFLISLFPFLFFSLPNQQIYLLTEYKKGINFNFLIIFLLILVFFILLAIFSEIFIILSAKKINEEKNKNGLVKKSWHYLGRVLFLRLSLFLIFCFCGFVFVFLLKKIPSLILFFLIILFLLINLLALFLIRYTILYLVIENHNLKQSLKRGLIFLKENWLRTFKISLFLFLIISLYGLLASIFLQSGIFTYPLRLSNFLLSNLFGKYGFWTVAIFTSIFVVILQVVITGFINTYQIVCWLLLFSKGREEMLKTQNKN